ncbi:ATP synthase F0 subunit C [Candidatus Parcubacteria bacterium]|nr:MAG: ATP synthase F0 subunit C [Candidatus Parcubacteria bacterium]
MDAEAMKYLAKAIIVFQMMGSALGEAFLIGKAFEAMGRNPEISGSLFSKMIIGAAITESTAIYALVAFFII